MFYKIIHRDLSILRERYAGIIYTVVQRVA